MALHKSGHWAYKWDWNPKMTHGTLFKPPTGPFMSFLYILYKFLYSLSVKKSKMTKKGSFFNFFLFRKFFLVKLPKIDVFLLRLVVFDKICAFQRGVKIQDFANFSDFWGFWPPSEMNIFRQKRPNATKIHQFWEVLSTCFPRIKKYQNKTPFWSFLFFHC